jgi:hypothetical protein
MSGGWTPVLKRTDVGLSGGASFLASGKLTVKRGGITLDSALVTADANGDKYLEAGTFVSEVTATGKYGAYDPQTNEVQTLLEGGSGLTSYTLTYSGQTTASIDDDATAAQVQAALEALSNLAPGDVTVSAVGSPDSVAGGLQVTFGGTLADTNVAQITATPTGGTGTVNIATSGSGEGTPTDGRETPSDNTSGYLLESVNLRDGDVVTGLLIEGSVLSARVHPAPDATTKAAVKGRIIFQ